MYKMPEQQKSDTFKQFLNDHFQKDGVFLALGMKEVNGKYVGGQSDLTFEQIDKVHNGEHVLTKKGKTYITVDTKEATHFELRLKYTENIVCLVVDGIKKNKDCSGAGSAAPRSTKRWVGSTTSTFYTGGMFS